ncbi:MAG TPA: NRDE family protein [Thermoanaerobaculia bacterium]
MCLIAIAHRVSKRYPLVIAANRDEAFDRPTLKAHQWEDYPDVFGGRDGVHGGSWLAVTRSGRFAAVTNLRGATPRERSRGVLVHDFVTSQSSAAEYADRIAGEADSFAGFHLLLGAPGEGIVQVSDGKPKQLSPGIHGLSNAPSGVHWEKVDLAVEAMSGALSATEPEAISGELLSFLSRRRGSVDPEREVFIEGDRYGTRSSTVVVAGAEGTLFVEQSYERGGLVLPKRVLTRF